MSYKDELLHPLWQKRKLEIFTRDKFTCQVCFRTDLPLHVHHRYYNENTPPWDYPDDALITLCEPCHNTEHLVGRNLNNDDLISIIKGQRMLVGMVTQLCVLTEEDEGFELELMKFLRERINIYYFNRKKSTNG